MQAIVKLKRKVLTGNVIMWNQPHPKYKGNIYFDDAKYAGFLTYNDTVVVHKLAAFSMLNLGTFAATLIYHTPQPSHGGC